MAWSYDPSTLNDTTSIGRLNAVRFLVGDTDSGDQQILDEEIEFSLVQTGDNIYLCASFVAESIASKYSRKVDIELDGALSAKYSQLAIQYTKLSTVLSQKAKRYSGSALGVGWGGISVSEINAVRANTDRVSPTFRSDRFLYPNVNDILNSYTQDN